MRSWIVSCVVIAGLSFATATCATDPAEVQGAADEVEPTAGPTRADDPEAGPGSSSPAPTHGGPEILASGAFEPIGYEGRGTARLIAEAGHVRLQLDDFQVERGPALRVYLSAAKVGSPETRYDDDFVDLGVLRGFEGDQSYDVPVDESVEDLRSVVIWCAEFDVGFIVAPLG